MFANMKKDVTDTSNLRLTVYFQLCNIERHIFQMKECLKERREQRHKAEGERLGWERE